MGVIARVRSALAGAPPIAPATQPPSIGATIAPYYVGKPQWLVRTPESLRREGLEKVSLIFRCLQYTANAAGHSGATLRVYDESIDGTRKPVDGHPLRQLMRRPNATMDEGRFLAFVAMRATAESFVVIEKVRSAAGRVVALEPLENDWLKPILRSQAPPDWEYRVPGIGEPFTLSSANVIAHTYSDRPTMRTNPLGQGPVESCFRELGLLNVMTDFLKVFFDRGAMPVYGALVDRGLPGQPAMPQAEKDAMAEAFLARHGGLNKAGMPIILEGITGVQRLSFDFDELALTDIRDVSDAAICQAFGIDPALVGTRIGMEHSDARANATEASRKFFRDVMTPAWDRLAESFSHGLIPEFERVPTTRELAFDLSNVRALQEDRNAKSPWMLQAATVGLISQYTFFTEMGLPLPSTPDFYLRPLATDAIAANDPLQAPPAAAPPPAKQDAPALSRLLADLGIADPLALAYPWPNPRALSPQWLEGPSQRMQKFRDLSRANIAKIAHNREPSISRFFADQRDRLTAAVQHGRVIVLPDGMSNGHARERLALPDFDWPAEDERLGKVLKQLHVLAGQTAYGQAAKHLNSDLAFDLANPRVRNVMDKLALRVKDITETTRKNVADVVTQAQTDGASRDELASRLTGLYDETYAGRSMTIARTESMASYGYASASAYRESGVVDRIQCFDNELHTADYGAEDGLSCAERDQLIDDLDSSELHVDSEHPNGSLAIAPVLAGDEG